MTRPKYRYQVVTHNGAGSYSGELRSLPKAREACRQIAEQEGPVLARIGHVNDFEIQRIQYVTANSFRYWMRCGKRWVLWDPHQDATTRKPDFVIRAGAES